MSGHPDSLILAMLRRMDGKLDRVAEDVGELKQRVTLLEGQYASISRRMERVEE